MSLIGDPKTRLTYEAKAYDPDQRVIAKCSVNASTLEDAIERTREEFTRVLGFRPKFVVWSRVR